MRSTQKRPAQRGRDVGGAEQNERVSFVMPEENPTAQFKKGDRVRLNAMAKEMGVGARHYDQSGLVIGFGAARQQQCVRVQFTGPRDPDLFHPEWLELDPRPATDEPRAHRAEKPAQGWRPIETAPKDGATIIGYCPTNVNAIEFMRWLGEEWLDPATHRCRPTHWMPLPEPPKADA